MHALSNLKGLCRPGRGLNRPVIAVVPSVETLGYSRDVPPGQGLPRGRGVPLSRRNAAGQTAAEILNLSRGAFKMALL